jgi:tRNA threonylcarbamoyladenosine modification (KEOPS) complex  Pcc1 subunit
MAIGPSEFVSKSFYENNHQEQLLTQSAETMTSKLVQSASATLSIDLESDELAKMIQSALLPEIDASPTDRCGASISVEGATLIIELTAGDLTALRAAMNSYLAWVSGCKMAVESVSDTRQNP